MGKSKREKHETDDTDVPKAKKAKTAVPAADDTLEEIDDGTAADVSMSDSRRWTDLSYDSKIAFTSAIAKPMASKKLAKRLFKLIRKASKLSRKENLRVGLKDCQLRIRKGEKGLLVFAGDVTPIEVMCHLPAFAKTRISHTFTSRSGLTSRPPSVSNDPLLWFSSNITPITKSSIMSATQTSKRCRFPSINSSSPNSSVNHFPY